MHIVILADPIDNQSAGVHFYTKNLIESLLKLDTENKYTFIHRKENNFFKDKNHIIIPKKNRLGYESYRKFFLIPKALNAIKPDIVLEPSHIGPFGLSKNIKRAVFIHDLTPILFPQFHIRKSPRTHKLLLPRILRNADLILTPSENTKKDIEKHYKTSAPIKAIYAGVNKPKLFPGKPEIKEPYLLCLGTIEPRKNLGTLIDAFLELKKEKNIPHKLVLAGGIGWKTKEILKKASNKDIILTGYISEEEKNSWIAHADIFIYPSFYEGFGIPPLEAMNYGIPVISSTGGSLKEIYKNKALLFDPNDKELLKTHIKRLLGNQELRKELKEKGLSHAKKLNWESTARKAIDAFKSVVLS